MIAAITLARHSVPPPQPAEPPLNTDQASVDPENDAELLAEFNALWRDAARLWDQYEHTEAFEGYVGSDFSEAWRVLKSLQGRASTFLEWGSGLGVVAIMAARMGFEASGIEIKPELVDLAQTLAQKYDADATFVCGSFVPEEFEPDASIGDEFFRTDSDSASGYEQLDRQLSDFDVVYAYPWPDEQGLFDSIMRRCGGRRAVLVRYDNREGISIRRPAKPKRRR
jgi:hypothetical protein